MVSNLGPYRQNEEHCCRSRKLHGVDHGCFAGGRFNIKSEVQSTDFIENTHCIPIWSLYFKAASHTAAAAIVFLSDPCGLMCYHLDGRPMNKYRVWEACNALQISWVGAKSSDSAKTIKEEKTSLGTCLKMISEVLQIIHWFWLLKSSPQ